MGKKEKKQGGGNDRLLAKNRRARHDYFIEESFEAGIELQGTEVKSCRQGKISLQEAYVDITGGEAWIRGMHISPYEQGNRYNADPLRDRRLLLHKREIRKLDQASMREGYTIIPLAVTLKGGLIKLEIGLAKGKKLYDKRQDLREEEDRRKVQRSMRQARNYRDFS